MIVSVGSFLSGDLGEAQMSTKEAKEFAEQV
jgi:hypothetical protein